MAKGTPGNRRLGGAEEAYRAGFENPLAGDIGPLQRLYGTVHAMGEELGGADMGTPFGQRFGERQAATREEVRRLQALRASHPEEFGRGQMMAQDQMDPYMFDLGIGTARGMGFNPMTAYREGGLVYEPVGGGAPGFMDFGVMRDGMEMAGQPRRGLGAGAGLGAMAMMAAAPGYMAEAPAGRTVQLPPIDVYGRQGASALSGQAPGAGSAFEEFRFPGPMRGRDPRGVPLPLPFRRDDRDYQQYYDRNPL